ncbi:carboxylate-amine ligase [Pyruvatibacter mobilis]|uniref:Putative glutamate--cysteine ligase 2 n=1 Tax=Pyruvatibacter mobilis TaxID=1712261 RepID=A0A845QDY0_9HYPH|nr:carboxylate-amine ligase [Pyruvatibacter mobilis]NBG96773.1 carboxylate-amine ligase [Pyruvatibacter mobilis]QJD74236.1 carboxylate-amine ligase [Pyruvatibacter mobilis]GGD05211.1 putative glutamate--cysteine ligase 2 [Pyruvatibacter mobilis]
MNRPAFTLGVEEEYLLVDRESRDLVAEPPADLMPTLSEAIGMQVSPEFLKSQVEIGTSVCATPAEVRKELKRLRGAVADVVSGYGYGFIAASTHPFARWTEQHHTQKARYDQIARDLAAAVRRMVICGMHIHCGIEDDDLRIDLMNQVTYFLPHMLALSASSPYWQGEDTGMASYRLTVFDALPRTGIPDSFDSWQEYQRVVSRLTDVGAIEDASKIWWDIRPSVRWPTLEARVADVCTRMEDAVALSALYQCLLSMLFTLREKNQRWRVYPRVLTEENRWRAQRYGATRDLADFGKGTMVPMGDLADELVGLLKEEASQLGCIEELLHVPQIARRGTSSQAQRQAYEEARAAGADHDEALRMVVDYLIDATMYEVKS